MKTVTHVTAAFVAAFLVWNTDVQAGEKMSGDITVANPWARASAGKARNGAAYMELINNGHKADRLVKAESPAAKHSSLHTHTMKDGVMSMGPVKAIEVSPGEPSVLRPGGLHIMLMGLKAPLKMGETFPMTLIFEKAGKITVQVKVAGPGAMGSMKHEGMKHDMMEHKGMEQKKMEHKEMKPEGMKMKGMKH